MGLQEPGDVIAGRYEVLSLLGVGGLGEVYLCLDRESQTRVAVKRLKDDKQIPASVIEQTQREAKVLSELRHRNIIRILDFSMDSRGYFFVLEFVDGPCLSEIIRNTPFDQNTFLHFATQCLEGLGAAHRRHLLHLDIKPANLMLHNYPNPNFTVKILDFGVARLVEETAHVGENEELYGSIYYISPEQLTQKPLDARSDLYSLGHVFYQSLSGAIAFPGVDEMMALAKAHLHQTPASLHDYKPDLDETLCQWVYWLLAKKPEDRPASDQAALFELTKIRLRLSKEARPEEFAIPEPEVEMESASVVPDKPAEKSFLGRLFNR
ncbi:MAG: serine/threonine-protein kinase [Methylacidiphilales bacterium]|nr:serine/threonine-protein kinase [Candidatus Methylacidiphilales bacterium]